MPDFPEITFKHSLRPSQAAVMNVIRQQLRRGERRLHVVAPPGSGKTVTGLYLWACQVKRPAVVLAPNSAIQSQWAARVDLFDVKSPTRQVVSTDTESPALLTSLTYQSVTMPRRGGESLDAQALMLWQERLIEKGQAQDPREALIWIEDLRKHNVDYYEQRLGGYRKEVRDAASIAGDSLDVLHRSSLQTLERLRDQQIGLLILDECHHLMGHWGRVLSDAHDMLGEPIILGLTATPPDRDGKDARDVERYDTFFGQIDYETPTPAVVKDGFLSPYQDLAYFVRPSAEELAFIANADDQLQAILDDLCRQAPATKRSASEPIAEQSVDDTTDSAAREPFGELVPVTQAPDESPAESATDMLEGHEAETTPSEADAATDTNRSTPLVPTEALPQWLWRSLANRELPTGSVKDWTAFERRDTRFANMARLFLLRYHLPFPPGVPWPSVDMPIEEYPPMEVLAPVLDRYIRHRLRRSTEESDHALARKAIRRLRMLGVQITETGMQACASPVGRVLAYSNGKARALPPILQREMAALGNQIRVVVVADYEKTSAVTAEIEHLLDAEAGGAIAAFKTLLADAQTNRLDPILVTGSSVLIDDDLRPAFEAAADTWLAERGSAVELRYRSFDGFEEVNGRGSDWSPRLYIELVTDLFQQGLSKCLVGTRGLLGEGWDANRINVLIDLTTVTTSMTVNQLRGRSIRLDPTWPDKLANNWDVVCIAPEFTKGLDDYRRFRAKHATIYGVTDDGAIEKGVGHVHPAFTELRPEGVEGAARALNADMLERVSLRDHMRGLWQIGEPYRDQPVRALEAKLIGSNEAGGFPPFDGSKEAWNAGSLASAIGAAVLATLQEVGMISGKHQIHIGERAGGYVRMFLEEASEEENELFTAALHEAIGPLTQPRYVIPRFIDRIEESWVSKLLPRILGQFFQSRSRERVMLHAVPSFAAKKKNLALTYQRYWNRFVSPGEALYAYQGEGKRLLNESLQKRQTPRSRVHEKEVFF